MILFLDDCPNRTKKFKSNFPNAITVTTAKEAIEKIAENKDAIEMLFLDHDLGGEMYVDSKREDTGMEVVRWIEINKPNIAEIIVHSCNPYAANIMEERLLKESYYVRRIPFTLMKFN